MRRILPLLLCILFLLSGCTSDSVSSLLEMELTEDYDTSDPFIQEKLFAADEDIDVLELGISFQMKGESGILEIAENDTKQVLWSDKWDEDVDGMEFTVSLDSIKKEKEYVVRFTGTKIKYARIIVTSENDLVEERERPSNASKD